MKVLLSNDDGVHAAGLAALGEAIAEIAAICIVAPDRNRSGASNSLSLENPLRVQELRPHVYSVEGTPTDCVHLALTGLLQETFDMVVAGINSGENLGDDVLYSGTVAAASEGRFLGLPAVAVSLASPNREFKHYKTAAHVSKVLVQRLQSDPLPSHTILNVNVPDIPLKDLRGFEVTRLGTRHSAEPTIKQQDPRGNTIYWVGPAGAEQDAGHGTDFHAIRSRKVSVTPMKLDFTHYEAFDQLAGWVDELKVADK